MKIEGFQIPKSSFLSVDKDMEIISQKILSNERVKRLLYYTTKDAIRKPNLSPEQSIELFGKNIKRCIFWIMFIISYSPWRRR